MNFSITTNGKFQQGFPHRYLVAIYCLALVNGMVYRIGMLRENLFFLINPLKQHLFQAFSYIEGVFIVLIDFY